MSGVAGARLAHDWDAVVCENCGKGRITGLHFQCFNCKNCSLCAICYSGLKEDDQHGGHMFVKLVRKFDDGVLLPPKKLSAYSDQPATRDLYNFPVRAHRGVKCDGCKKEGFFGPRYHCFQCLHIDLCQLCYYDTVHDASHAFILIAWPHGCQKLLYPQAATSEESALHEFILTEIEKFNEAVCERHGCACDVCDDAIKGTRYQSVQNAGINLCAECYHSNKHSLSDEFYAHDRVASSERVNQDRPLMKYPPRNAGAAAARAAEVSQPVTHEFIDCSVCQVSPVVGMRYRCSLCETDLCTQCYDDEMHAASGHPMWEMARPNEPGVLLPPRPITERCLQATYFGERHGEFAPSGCTVCTTKGILGPLYSCLTKNSDLCKHCYDCGAGHIDQSYKLRFEPGSEAVELKPRFNSQRGKVLGLDAQVRGLRVSESEASQEWRRHEGSTCKSCISNGIFGKLYSCLECHCHLCANCFGRGEHAVGHAFAKIDRPFAGEAFAGLRDGCDGHLVGHVAM